MQGSCWNIRAIYGSRGHIRADDRHYGESLGTVRGMTPLSDDSIHYVNEDHIQE